jgi:hypothetical protein
VKPAVPESQGPERRDLGELEQSENIDREHRTRTIPLVQCQVDPVLPLKHSATLHYRPGHWHHRGPGVPMHADPSNRQIETVHGGLRSLLRSLRRRDRESFE